MALWGAPSPELIFPPRAPSGRVFVTQSGRVQLNQRLRVVVRCATVGGTGRLPVGVEQLVLARRKVIRGVADHHEVDGIRWWPPTASPRWLDFLIEGVPSSLLAFRTDLEHALGCRVALYLADQMTPEAWHRIEAETVPV
jgi:hypothetical protein